MRWRLTTIPSAQNLRNFSWEQIEKQLGMTIQPANAVHSFAEIESVLIAHWQIGQVV